MVGGLVRAFVSDGRLGTDATVLRRVPALRPTAKVLVKARAAPHLIYIM